MTSRNHDPKAVANVSLGDGHGGNTDQPDDGRDEAGRLPAPQDAADYQAPAGSNPFADDAQQESAGKPTGAPVKKAPAKAVKAAKP